MLRYTVYRLVFMIPTFLGMSLIIFVLMHRIPGSPFQLATASHALSADEIHNL